MLIYRSPSSRLPGHPFGKIPAVPVKPANHAHNSTLSYEPEAANSASGILFVFLSLSWIRERPRTVQMRRYQADRRAARCRPENAFIRR